MNIENKKQFVIILLAAGLGLVAAFLTSQYVEGNLRAQTQKISQDYQKQMSENQAQLRQEMDLRQRDLNNKIAEVAKMAQEAKVVTVESKDKQPVVQMSAFSVKTPPGKRAVTLNINSLAAVGGLINPGDYVDVIGHLNIPNPEDPKAGAEKLTTVLFQNLQVLAVGTNFTPIGSAPAYDAQQKATSLKITFAVTPEEAGLLAFAETQGQLQLSLRSPAERGNQIMKVASWDSLSEYVLEKQGTRLEVPEAKPAAKKEQKSDLEMLEESDEVKPFIRIFQGGREL